MRKKSCSDATVNIALEAENELESEQVSQLFYERPGTIINNDLLDPKVAHRNWLKKTLVEHFDYEVIC